MKNGDAADEDDSEDYRAIFEGLELGTEATRTGIIGNARASGYIELKKDVYTILPGGEFLIESLSGMDISMDKYKTSTLGVALKKVFHGEYTVRDSVELAEREIAEIMERREPLPPETDRDTGFYGDVVGVCPVCGKNVIRGKFSYGCSGYKEGCMFKVGLRICSRPISVSNIRLLLEQGRTAVIDGFVSKKTGRSFSAALRLDGDKAVFDFSGSPRRASVPEMPVCSSRYASTDPRGDGVSRYD